MNTPAALQPNDEHVGESRWPAACAVVVAIVLQVITAMNIGNVTSLALLLRRLVNGTKLDGRSLMLSAVEIWLTSVIVFGLWFWELDRGGPIARARGDNDDSDLLFAQMSDPTLSLRPWTPTFVDYLYVSLTNSTAFSPADNRPFVLVGCCDPPAR